MTARDDIPAAEGDPELLNDLWSFLHQHWVGLGREAGEGTHGLDVLNFRNRVRAEMVRQRRSSRPAPHESDRDRAAEEDRIREEVIVRVHDLLCCDPAEDEPAAEIVSEAFNRDDRASMSKRIAEMGEALCAALRSTTTAEGEKR